ALAVAPPAVTLGLGATQQFTATASDQFGHAMNATVAWTATGGTLTSSGLYTAGAAAGAFGVTATSGALSASAAVSIKDAAPTVAQPPAANPNPVTAK